GASGFWRPGMQGGANRVIVPGSMETLVDPVVESEVAAAAATIVPASTPDVRALGEEVERESVWVDSVMAEVGKVVIGQKYMIDRVLIGLLANGHCLIEGVPGLAKTLTVKTLAQTIHASFM